VKYPDFTWASCRNMDTNTFYYDDDLPRGETNEDYKVLKRICADCPMLEECLTWALHHEDHGFWGGTTEYERRTLRKKFGIQYENLIVGVMK